MDRREFMKVGVSVAGVSLIGRVGISGNRAVMDEKSAGRKLSREASFYRGEGCIREACPWVDWKKRPDWDLECPFKYDYRDEVLLCRAENTEDQPERKYLWPADVRQCWGTGKWED